MTRHARSGGWKGRSNQGSRERRRGRGPSPAAEIEGEVRWIDRDADVVHLLVSAGSGGTEELVGEIVEISYARPKLRLRIGDRDRDGRLDGDDMALGDRVQAKGVRVRRARRGQQGRRVEVDRLEVL